jgi:UDP-N-acetylglucosamine acyltransferase
MMGTTIHPTALVDPEAKVADGVVIGPYTVIEADVVIGADCEIGPFCRFDSGTSVGAHNRFESHCSVGAPPQDLKYAGEATGLEIGVENVFREFVTINRGTAGGGGLTRIGDKSLFMAYAHVGHDCLVGSGTIFANCATLAGHVEVCDFATVGALSAVHQFSRVGQHAFLGGYTGANKDCLPFMSTIGNRPPKCYGPNTIGLERKGYSEESRRALKRLWHFLRDPKLNTSQAIDRIREELGGQQEVEVVLQFIDSSERGVILG